MTQTTVVCDRCRAIITVDRTPLRVDSGPFRHVLGDVGAVDLCRSCAEAFAAWLATGTEAVVRECEALPAENPAP